MVEVKRTRQKALAHLRITFLLLMPLAALPAQVSAQSLDRSVADDLSSWLTGFVVVVMHQGEVQFSESFGTRAAVPDSALALTDVFAFPALTEILVGVTVEALHAAGIVDANAPISTYLGDLDAGVGSATLSQLVTHTAGLDNAARLQGETWQRTLERVNDYALVAKPGTVYSESQHSLPMAVRVLESVVGFPFDAIATSAVLSPLGMTSSTFDLRVANARGLVRGVLPNNEVGSTARIVEPTDTVGGLPVLFTTAQDVMVLLSAWIDGVVQGRGPEEIASAEHPALGDARRFGGGVWVDTWYGRTRVFRISSVSGTSAGFYLIPETRSIVFIWAVGGWPARTTRFVLDMVVEVVGTAAAPSGPGRGMGDPEAEYAPLDATRWAGTYRNGELILVLREREGTLVFFDGARELPTRRVSETAVTAFLPDGRAAVTLDLRTDEDGRRFLYFGNLAYRHQDDLIRR